MSIFDKLQKLFIGTSSISMNKYDTFIHVDSIWNDPWYNFIIPTVSEINLLDMDEVSEVVGDMKKQGKELAYYIPEIIFNGYSDWVAQNGLDEVGQDHYMLIKLEEKKKILLPDGYTITTNYDIKEVSKVLSEIFVDWPEEDKYVQLFEQYKLEGQENRLFETFCVMYEGRVVGAASVIIDKELGIAYYHNTGVVSEHRRKGLHIALMNARHNYCIENGINEVVSLVDSADHSFAGLQRMGFEIVDKYYIYSIK